jgi:phospholipase C
MKFLAKCFSHMFLLLCLGTTVVQAQLPYPNPFRHIVVIVQENRTPDNLFRGLLTWPGINPANYDIATWGVNSKGQLIPLEPIALGIPYDLSHAHSAFVSMYDGGRMDGADKIPCIGVCAPNPQFKYVDNSQHILDPYLNLAGEYGWANAMFQTNQGPSFPAHQFLFGGTSAPSAADDRLGVFVAENPAAPKGAGYSAGLDTGCLSPLNEWHWLIGPTGVETKLINNPLGTLCFSHDTMGKLLDDSGLSWKYYAPATINPGGSNPGGSIWTAPNSIREICQPNQSYSECLGQEWATKVDLKPADVLSDIRACRLANVSWVIPDGRNSDHAGSRATTGGPSWVASIVNTIGTDTTCEGGAGYWSDTAIVITWDDWGGWYDHVAPSVLSSPQGDYQYGFRVPLIVASAYTPKAYVNNIRHDFGSILKFIESVFDIPEGSLGFADQRANGDLSGFFDFRQPPRKFQSIHATLDADYFINDSRPPEPPDND